MNEIKFEHNGFECMIHERPDLCHSYKVYGHRKTDDKVFYPDILFDRDMTIEDIKKVCIDMMDGKFSGSVEVYGDHSVVISAA